MKTCYNVLMTAHASKWILEFKEVAKEDVGEAGGKGANLGEMTRASFPVPPGFIVSAACYRQFISENNLKPQVENILKTANKESPEELAQASEKITRLFERSQLNKETAKTIIDRYHKMSGLLKQALVAIRSSATAEDLPQASFAGQQQTFLNVQGEANVVEKIKKCWASLFTARAIFYREQHNFDHFKAAVAVVVQEMIQSEVSGVAFTSDPLGRDKHKMLIEAVWGLGELIVQGSVTPDRYMLERHTLKVIEISKSPQNVQLIKVGRDNREKRVPRHRVNRQKLGEAKIKELAKILQKIHNHYYFPQDIEWAYRDGKFYIIQSRPVTTLKQHTTDNIQHREETKVGEVLLRGQGAGPGIATGHVKVVASLKQLEKIKRGDILIARMTSPDFVPAMKKASAIVTDEGGTTSHAAIVSRELGIPCVVGTGEATKVLRDGMVVTVHGRDGVVYKGGRFAEHRTQDIGHREEVKPREDIRTATKLYVNLAEPELAEKMSRLPVDGVGLLRAEFILAQIGSHPKHLIAQGRQEEFINKLAENLRQFCMYFSPRPVVYRTTDLKTNEYRNLDGGRDYEPKEANPMLGYRGAYRYIADPDVFELELAAIREVRKEFKNLWVMLPFVRSPEELIQVKRVMAASGLVRSPTFKIWLMVELPANVILLDKFIDAGVDGISIGSNDLTMLILGTDRDNREVASAFSELNPAVLWALEKTIKTCQRRKIVSSICGQAPSDYDELVEYLVRLGISSISVNPDAVGRVQKVVYEAERAIVRKKVF